ncbi:dihydroxy-acid dehydratase domain-containing protein [Ureibacillus sinduriensis]|uniref:Dihydroxy-acid dehydratase n=1 Tax=Ureibacillus sinduriensis BLB-1 = JCM 15800 TaxID=1384057 RepID=A0A0A3HZC8_9BACL|nr:dihydroxy-acid dehydratase [Ureibacillus sinduriensis]KGR77936.1 dihydroxy-acid dehydratase [Ureibacillus sinduriensis BLB-1 = JCM 15800]
MLFPKIEKGRNPYAENVQGKANEPITVAGLLDRAKQILGPLYEGGVPDWTLDEIYNRLENNAPRIAIIGGSADHPAHIMDYLTSSRAALRIWQDGGVPFYFSTPVMCDGTAQSNQGMSYSLQSRNAVAQMVVNQLEAHSYHGAFVIQGCDKQPLGVVSALAHLDRLRQSRGDAPFFATFAPAHVLQGGTIPEDVVIKLNKVFDKAIDMGYKDIADDLKDTMSYILQCSLNTSFQGLFERAVERNVMTKEEHKYFEMRLAVATCDSQGGVCAFNGTGNSSRHVVAGLGLVHPAVELLTQPPNQQQINETIDALAKMINKPEFGVAEIVHANIKNAIRIHSASGGSTNLMMHMVAAMIYAGYKFTLWDVEKIHKAHPIPDLFDYSLTEGRDIFALAMQCCSGNSRGMETLFYELLNNKVPMDEEALTVTGTNWRTRIQYSDALPAGNVKENPVILNTPRRPFSGVDVLQGNFFESAVVKISGMPTPQLNQFDDKLAFVLYFENEDQANENLLDSQLIEKIKEKRHFDENALIQSLKYNAPERFDELKNAPYDELFDEMAKEGILKIAVLIAGQGPVAFGMPEMFTPMQHINANRILKRVCTIISDGRYSGVTYGAAIGHMTPESIQGGGIGYLKTGDVLHLQLRNRRIDLVNSKTLVNESLLNYVEDLKLDQDRQLLYQKRLSNIKQRQKSVAAVNRMVGHTDASCGVVPIQVFEEAELAYKEHHSHLLLP